MSPVSIMRHLTMFLASTLPFWYNADKLEHVHAVPDG